MRLSDIAPIGVVACATITSVVLYIDGAASQRVSTHRAASGGTTVTLDLLTSKTTTASSSATSSRHRGLR